MELHVLGSSSKGNCYILKTDTGSLLIEAGIPFKEIKKALDFDLSDIMGCLVTHEHKDHCKAIEDIMSAGIDVFMSLGTADTLSLNSHRLHILHSPYKEFIMQDFVIRAFETEHDATEPIGFLIAYKPTGETLLFATDTYYIRYNFKDLNYILIECNYDYEILEWNLGQGLIDITHRNRLIHSHFSLPNVLGFLAANNMSTVKAIVLLHLSDQNSDAHKMNIEIQKQTGRPVFVASPGMVIPLVKCPF